MTQVMSVDEREWFLSGVRLGVVGIAAGDDRAPFTVPIWYGYEAGGEVSFMTAEDSRKIPALRAAGRLSLCAHNDDPPYRYVTVEGPVTSITPPSVAEITALAHRYLGPELGDRYVASTNVDGMLLVRMRPEHWSSADFGKRD